MLKYLSGLLLALFTTTASAHDEPVVGALAGAGIGAAVGGPAGAAVGAVIGTIIGATEAHETDHGPNAHRHHGQARITERVRYPANGKGHAYARGTVVRCEPERVYYRPSTLAADDRPKAVRTKTVTRTTMKRVCRDVPVKTRITVAAR
jgi:hypothetical protein